MQRRLRGKGPAVRVHVGLQPVADGEQQPDSNPVDPVEQILQPAADGEQQTDSVPAEPVEETLQPGADGEQQTHSVPVESVEETLQPGADGEQQTDSVPVESVEDAPGEQGETPLVGGQRLTSSLLKQVMAEAIRGEDVVARIFGVTAWRSKTERVKGSVEPRPAPQRQCCLSLTFA